MLLFKKKKIRNKRLQPIVNCNNNVNKANKLLVAQKNITIIMIIYMSIIIIIILD